MGHGVHCCGSAEVTHHFGFTAIVWQPLEESIPDGMLASSCAPNPGRPCLPTAQPLEDSDPDGALAGLGNRLKKLAGGGGSNGAANGGGV